ncbi:type IVB secretion system protein IcmH/DotU [Arenibaculum pallidiluteum]|uniref:type IVB secretion system protein IcmH/DotU n=1 Tax=Arenibaculum pallidiluteum TaxID=2812559 RepID=UPI001A958E99|nr:type IVB secretion system protein IcmH/DotU [Arenibaculum pallidiluteum]
MVDRTVIAPSDVFLGLARGGGVVPVAVSDEPVDIWDRISLGRTSPLVTAAAPLLNLCVRIRNLASHPDAEALRMQVLSEVERFEQRIAPLGLAARSVRAGKYALCATIDDLVLNTPWGSRSVWTTRSMVGTLFSETWGGDRFFDLLAQLKREPSANLDLLELLYYCLSLGFEGRYRIAPRGTSELSQVRDDLFRLIRTARGALERDISPNWRGVAAAHHQPATAIPPWTVVAASAGLLLAVFTALLLAINARSDQAFTALAGLPPTGPVTISRPAPVVPPPPPPVVVAQAAALRSFLEPEIREGLVTVTEDARSIAVRIVGDGMFDSGRAEVLERFTSVLRRIGQALNDQPGDVLVTGHTDDRPIRSLKFPSNWELSFARARAAAAIIGATMADAGRLRAEGKAASEPLASNDTPQGRQQNRRIELAITKAP